MAYNHSFEFSFFHSYYISYTGHQRDFVHHSHSMVHFGPSCGATTSMQGFRVCWDRDTEHGEWKSLTCLFHLEVIHISYANIFLAKASHVTVIHSKSNMGPKGKKNWREILVLLTPSSLCLSHNRPMNLRDERLRQARLREPADQEVGTLDLKILSGPGCQVLLWIGDGGGEETQ